MKQLGLIFLSLVWCALIGYAVYLHS